MTDIKYTKKINKNIGIYAIINQVNGKMYVGQSSVLRNRKKRHFTDLRCNRHGMNCRKGKWIGQIDHLQKSFNKYGEQSFKWEVLEYCKKEKLTEREQFYMNKYNSTNPFCGYNISVKAGQGIMSPEGRERISQLTKGKKRPVDVMEKLRQANIGRKCSEETKERIRKANTGREKSKETREKMSKIMKGRIFSNKHKERISQALAGKKRPIELMKNIGQIQRKYKHLTKEWQGLRNQGLSYAKIGENYNIDATTINRYLSKYYPEEEIINVNA